MTAAWVARQTGWDHARVSRIESGHVGITDVDVIFYPGACGIYAKDAKDLLRLCRTAEHKGYWLSPRRHPGCRPLMDRRSGSASAAL